MTDEARDEAREQGRGIGGMSPREAAWLAWYMCAVSLMMTALGLFLLMLSYYALYAFAPSFDYWLLNTVVAISFSTGGAVIAPRLPLHSRPVGWLFCTIGFVAALRFFVAEYALVTLLAEPGALFATLPGGEALAWVSSWLWVPHIGLFVFLALLFPDGRLPSPRWRAFAWLVGMVVVAATVVVAYAPTTAAGFDLLNHPLGIQVATHAINPGETILYALALVAASSLLVRLRHSKGVERQQVKWFAYAVTALATSAVFAYVISASMSVVWLEWVSTVLVIVSVGGLPVAVGIAILRYKLYEIDLLINRTLVYGSLTAVLVGVYLGSVVLFQELFRTLTGQESQLGIVASTLAIAALFNPVRRRIQTFVDRRFYRRKYDARKTLEAFSTELRDETDLDALSDDLVAVVRETMQPKHASVWVRPDPALKGKKRAAIRESRHDE